LTTIDEDEDVSESLVVVVVVDVDAWLDVFARSTVEFETRAREHERAEGGDGARARAFADAFARVVEACRAPARDDDGGEGGTTRATTREAARSETSMAYDAPWTGLNCLEMCRVRDGLLRSHGFYDCFARVKREENAAALKTLPEVLASVDAVDDADGARLMNVIRGCFAGNIFDLGAAESAALFGRGGGDFASTKETLKQRPWCVDDFDALKTRWLNGEPHKKAIMFVDNSGADIVLGMIPFARELLRRGTHVVLAANTVPSINDITAEELVEQILPALVDLGDAILSPAIADGRLRVVASGNDMPVIDLRYLSQEIVHEAKDADFVILEGMGRGVETNLYAEFTIDALKIAMIKHQEVATLLGGELYDCVVKFDPAPLGTD
jgi:type II pantothenate kinase